MDPEELTETICHDEYTEDDNAPEEADFQGAIFKRRGISLDGIVLEAGVNAKNDDPLCSVSDCRALPGIDVCMGHANTPGTYHLHSFSACTYDKTVINETHMDC